MNAVPALIPSAGPSVLGEFLAEAKCPIPANCQWMWKIPLGKTPFKHQIETVNHYARHVRAGDWSEAGTGKTLPVQAYGVWLAAQGNKVVCIMPPVLIPQFIASYKANYPGITNQIKIQAFMGTTAQRAEMLAQWEYSGWPDILVMSYRMFAGNKECWGRVGLTPSEFTWRTLFSRGYTQVIVDEATVVKHSSSQIHRAVKAFSGPLHDSNGVILMTGTPIETSCEDAYGYIAILHPTRYGSKRAFDRIHCIKAPDSGKTVGYVNTEYLYQGLYLSGRRTTKREAADLPPRIISELPFNLSNEHQALYKRLVDERVLEFEDGRIIDATTASALYQSMQQILMTPERYTDKPPKENVLIDALDEQVHQLHGHKVLVYCWYQATIEKLQEHFAHLKPAIIYGGVTGNARERNKQAFITDPECRMAIVQFRSGGVGIDGWQQVCSHTIIAEICPIPGVFEQALARLHRTGQSEPVNVYLLVPLRTIAVRLRNNLIKRDEDANAVVRDKRTLLRELMGEDGLQGSLD